MGSCGLQKTAVGDKRRYLRATVELAECGFAGYWNIKGCGYMVRDFNRKFLELTALRCGAFLAIAPQMRHTKKREDQP